MQEPALIVDLVDVGDRSRLERAGFCSFEAWLESLVPYLEAVPGVIVNRDPLITHRDPVAVGARRGS